MMNRRFLRRRSGELATPGLACGLLLLGVGCASDPDDEPVPSGQIGGEPASCDVLETPLSADEVSPLGFAAEEVLAFAQGDHEGTLSYDDGETTDLVISVGPPSSIVFADAEMAAGSGAEIGCPDAIEMVVSIGLTTADGAFAETLSAVLRAETADAASWFVSVLPSDLVGSYDVASLGMDAYEDVEIAFDGRFTAAALEGNIAAWGSQTTGEGPDASVSRESFVIADFGGAVD